MLEDLEKLSAADLCCSNTTITVDDRGRRNRLQAGDVGGERAHIE